MKYQNINTLEIKDYRRIKEENSNISFPKNGGDIILNEWKKIAETTPPVYDELTHRLEEVEPVDFVQTWEVVALPLDKVFANKKRTVEKAVVKLIQSKVDEYNTVNGLSFRDVYSCALYKDMTGYAHKDFCTNIWNWQTSVWEHLRQVQTDILSGTRTEPTLDDLMLELPQLTI